MKPLGCCKECKKLGNILALEKKMSEMRESSEATRAVIE